MTYTEEQIKIWKEKAEKWDKLEDRIADCYGSEVDGEWVENEDEDMDLGYIGEIAASAFGFL